MPKLFIGLVATIVLLAISGCSNLIGMGEEKETNGPEKVGSVFIGTIKKIYDQKAFVNAKNGGILEGNVIVDLSVNNDETFQIGDKIKVEFDGTILESSPAQINTLSVKLVD